VRCFYCGQPRDRASTEHVPSAFLGSRLKTRRVCVACNQRAGREIDDRLAAYLMVQMPKALANVRSLRRQSSAPSVEVDGVVSATGEAVRVSFGAYGREARRLDGTRVDDVVEVAYGMESDLWLRFIAKVALGCAAQLFDDSWVDHPTARAVRAVLWHERIDASIWPGGLPGWPEKVDPPEPLRQALGDDRHLVGLAAADDRPGSSVALSLLFGGQITCRLALPGVAVPGSGVMWVIDWHPGDPPPREDFDAAVERMLRERGWTAAQIDAVRLS
jgi:hypothetical protein